MTYDVVMGDNRPSRSFGSDPKCSVCQVSNAIACYLPPYDTPSTVLGMRLF